MYLVSWVLFPDVFKLTIKDSHHISHTLYTKCHASVTSLKVNRLSTKTATSIYQLLTSVKHLNPEHTLYFDWVFLCSRLRTSNICFDSINHSTLIHPKSVRIFKLLCLIFLSMFQLFCKAECVCVCMLLGQLHVETTQKIFCYDFLLIHHMLTDSNEEKQGPHPDNL